jgi:multidrug resistance efflux pump
MSKTMRIVLVVWIMVLAIIGGFVWWYMNSNARFAHDVTTPVTSGQTGTQIQPTSDSGTQTAQSGQQAQTAQDSVSGSVGATTNTDDSMAQDASAIDSQLSGLNDDNASADHGLSSQ